MPEENREEMMHSKITQYLGKITRYLRLESASRVTAESTVARAVTALNRPSLHSLTPTKVAPRLSKLPDIFRFHKVNFAEFERERRKKRS